MFGRRLRTVSGVLACFMVVGCLPKGDTYIRVSGMLAEEPTPQTSCVLGIYAVHSNRLIDYRTVGQSFQTSFVLLAKPAEYYFEAKCDKGRIYRSGNFELGKAATFNKMINLGRLHLIVKEKE